VASKPGRKYDDSLDAFGVHGVGGMLGALLTGVFASLVLYNDAAGNAADKPLGKLAAGGIVQLGVQFIAAAVAAGYAFVASVVLVKVIDKVWGFALPAEAENVGLDRSEHGEVGFDYGGGALEEVPEVRLPEPKAADVPPDGKGRFTVIIENVNPQELMAEWSSLCQAGKGPASEDFRAIYPYLTTVRGNRFHFRGGDRYKLRGHLIRLFSDKISSTVRAHIEE
jgi:ammonium transporter, Amt family